MDGALCTTGQALPRRHLAILSMHHAHSITVGDPEPSRSLFPLTLPERAEALGGTSGSTTSSPSPVFLPFTTCLWACMRVATTQMGLVSSTLPAPASDATARDWGTVRVTPGTSPVAAPRSRLYRVK